MYRLRQIPLNFYNRLQQGLESRVFVKSNHNDCMFTNEETIILFWVDDCIFYSKTSKKIDGLILSLKDELLLEREEDTAG